MWAIKGVVILSGDRHEHATTEVRSPDSSASVEFSTSALSQFCQLFDRQYRQIEDTGIEIYSHPRVISKFGVLDFETSVEGAWQLDFHLIVNGKEVWNKTVAFNG